MSEGALAIVGASCRFPGAAGLAAFWRLLSDGIDAISEIGPDRWSTRFFYHPSRGEPGKSYTWAAGLIDGIDQFEPGFFGISPREAAEMDPQQRLLLELAWHALEDAGIPAGRLAGSATGVYVGASSTDYGDLRLGDPASGGPHFLSGSTLSILANRLSHVFDLRGPSQVIDTACSSSLVALHAACGALRAGQIEAALVGGINLLLSPYPFIGFAQAGMLSPRGRCFAFDARADGYVRGEGGAVVVLKPLARAVADGDRIHALIRGTAVNASGRTIGLSLPSAAAQANLLHHVYADAGITPEALGFVEMHGTGTPAGDPAEAEAVGRVLGKARQTPLPIGSVKTNIGHLEPASGIAGLLKAMLALEHGVLPRSLHGETPNPDIPFDRLNLRLAGVTQPIASDAAAGINSFGFGGSNAHAILGAPPRPNEPPAEDRARPPLMISARSGGALRALVREWRGVLATTPAERQPRLIRAAARRRDQHSHRLVVLADDPATVLDDFLEGRANPAAVEGLASRDGGLAFVYSGNGAQFPGMGQAAYRASVAFRAALAEADRALSPHLGWSVVERIAGDIAEEELRRADIAQPMLFAIQVAITSLLRDGGAAPGGFVGHSVGEIAAAWAAGALSLDDAARTVALRSRRQEQTRGTGRMAVLALGADTAEALLHELGGEIEIAAINSARSVTVTGPAGAISRLGKAAAGQSIAWRPLDLDFAFHSVAMEPIRDELIAELGAMSAAAPVGDLVSTVTGARIAAGALDAVHWWRNVRDPVRFSAAIKTLVADGYRLFVEIGPTPVLLSYLRDALHAAEPAGGVIATLNRHDAPGDPFAAIAARLHVAGQDMSGGAWLDGLDDLRGLPLYPWQRQRCWFGHTPEAAEPVSPLCDHPLLGFRQAGAATAWVNHLDTALFPFIADHRIEGAPVLPAAAIIDMALAAARTRHPEATALQLCDVELLRPVALDDGAREMRCTLFPDGAWQLAGRKRLAHQAMTLHATARVVATAPRKLQPAEDVGAGHEAVTATMLYRRAARRGLDYGDSFRTVEAVLLLDAGRAVATLRPRPPATACLLDPSLLDGAFQALLALVDDGADDRLYLPRRFGRVVAATPFGRAPARADVRLARRGTRSVAAEIALFDAAGDAVVELSECWFVGVDLPHTSADFYLHTELVPAPLTSNPAALDRLSEIVPRIATRNRDSATEREPALLFDALLVAISRETTVPAFAEALLAPSRRFSGEALPDSGELWRSLLADHPEMVGELTVAAMLRDGQPVDGASPGVAALCQGSMGVTEGRTALGAVLDEIAGNWPRDRPLRIHERGPYRLNDRLGRSGLATTQVGEGEPCDLAVFGPIDALDVSRLNLVPGGALLALKPASGTLWDVVGDRQDWRSALVAGGFSDVASVLISDGPGPCEMIWARLPTALPQSTSPGKALSLALVAGTADDSLAVALEVQGHRIVSIEQAGDAIAFAVGDEKDPATAGRLVPRFARLAEAAAARGVPLWLVTAGAQQASEYGGLYGSALWGFGRVLRNEIPGLVLRMIDLPSGLRPDDRARRLAAELMEADVESEIVWTPRGRNVMRARRGLPPVWAGPSDAVVASAVQPGRLDRLEWLRLQARPPGPGEIEIEVRAAGINFRDVMAATGGLPEEALLDGFAGAALGLECAGVVSAIGDGVEKIAVGDRVVGFAPAALANRVVTRADAVIAMPADLNFVAAATLPVAFVTARYSLITLARLMPGESVLIHAASGGVGLATIQIAKACGATVIASAGSPAKRAFLRLVGADYVCDSRELRFVAAVREATGGAGVDVILNSLSGEAMEASLGLLKPFGRFVELGKRDLYENRAFRPRPFRQNVSYFAVDLDQLPVRRPELAKALLGEVAAALKAGEIRPLAHRRFAFADIAAAFRLMQAAQHIGKLVLVPDGNAGVAVSRALDLVLHRDGAYVVTGGLDGFGFAASRWLAVHGAGHLALIGRRGLDTPGAGERIADLEALGATVSVHAADVGDREALRATLDTVRRHGLPIRGIVHAATAIVNGTAATLSPEDVTTAMHAKVMGAQNLDWLTGHDPIDLFWLFSSATTVVGAPAQGAYVAANAALEALAQRRHDEGRPALAIAWGPIADAGTLAGRPDEQAALLRRLGARVVPADRALAALPILASSGLPVVVLADIAWGEAARMLPILADPLFDEVRGAAAEITADEALLDRLAALEPAERRELLAVVIASEAAGILRLPEGRIDPHRPFAELGMDSLMAIELRLALETRLRLDVPLTSLADGASAAGLAARLVEKAAPTLEDAALTKLASRHETVPDPFALGGVGLAAEE
ncbi:MAG TPA: SDR family NAD(P)-dependent oxidoreductase [Stellaceae bacterium]|nr:SDR family NAD(P)-dependent oxidoreductase [Stellaceae bacterium]